MLIVDSHAFHFQGMLNEALSNYKITQLKYSLQQSLIKWSI